MGSDNIAPKGEKIDYWGIKENHSYYNGYDHPKVTVKKQICNITAVLKFHEVTVIRKKKNLQKDSLGHQS